MLPIPPFDDDLFMLRLLLLLRSFRMLLRLLMLSSRLEVEGRICAMPTPFVMEVGRLLICFLCSVVVPGFLSLEAVWIEFESNCLLLLWLTLL